MDEPEEKQPEKDRTAGSMELTSIQPNRAREVETVISGGEQLETQDDVSDSDDDCLKLLGAKRRSDCLGTIGSYDVLEVIGRGGMGIVYRAFDTRLNRIVAIKMMLPRFYAGESARKRFLREAQTAAAVSHENIVTIHAVEESGGYPFIVMEYVTGSSLQQRIDREGSLPIAEVIRICREVASGLESAHQRGLIHRDIKPANLLQDATTGRIRITDFGLARPASDTSLSAAGTIVGTPDYMAPEQVHGQNPDHRADLFALGSVLHALCAGAPPFRGATITSTMLNLCEKPHPRLPSSLAGLSPRLTSLIDRLLAKNPDERIQTASEVVRILAELAAPAQVSPSWFRQKTTHLAALAAALVFAIGWPTYYYLTNYGMLEIQSTSPVKVCVQVDGSEVAICHSDSGTGVQLAPGLYKLKILVGNGQLERTEVVLHRGERTIVVVKGGPSPEKTLLPVGNEPQ